MTRATSKAAYRDLDRAKRRAEVLRYIERRPKKGWTRQELATAMGWPINCVTGRVTELRDMGAVVEEGRCRKNPASGKSCNVVRVAN